MKSSYDTRGISTACCNKRNVTGRPKFESRQNMGTFRNYFLTGSKAHAPSQTNGYGE
jgi:hypothetical protein